LLRRGFAAKTWLQPCLFEAADKLFDSTTWRLLPQGRQLGPIRTSIAHGGHWNKAGMVIHIIRSGYMPVWNNLALTGWISMKFYTGGPIKVCKGNSFSQCKIKTSEIRTYISCQLHIFLKVCCLWGNYEKCGRLRQVINRWWNMMGHKKSSDLCTGN
jgi:hypothetical protein